MHPLSSGPTLHVSAARSVAAVPRGTRWGHVTRNQLARRTRAEIVHSPVMPACDSRCVARRASVTGGGSNVRVGHWEYKRCRLAPVSSTPLPFLPPTPTPAASVSRESRLPRCRPLPPPPPRGNHLDAVEEAERAVSAGADRDGRLLRRCRGRVGLRVGGGGGRRRLGGGHASGARRGRRGDRRRARYVHTRARLRSRLTVAGGDLFVSLVDRSM
jgi:hypothetical protein